MEKSQNLGFGATMARAGCVVEVPYLCPLCSQYCTQQYCQKQFALKVDVAKVITDPKVLRLVLSGGGCTNN